MRLNPLLLVLFLLLASCVSHEGHDHDHADEKAADNTLTKHEKADGWVLMFNGKDLSGWQCSADHPESARAENGTIVTNGKRAHLFYGEKGDAVLKDFELKADVKCVGPSNSGIFFHTKLQDEGWPKQGFEAQICNGFGDPRKTASVYAFADIAESPAKDDVWFHYHLKVEGKRVQIWIDGKLAQDWTQPDNWENKARKIASGTVALQCHDAGSTVLFKNLKLRELE